MNETILKPVLFTWNKGLNCWFREELLPNILTFVPMQRFIFIPGLFRQRKPKRFTYRPLFYDQRKEAREDRMKKYMTGTDLEDKLKYMPSLRKGSFRDHHKITHRNVHTKSNIRLFVIILLLALLTYILFLR